MTRYRISKQFQFAASHQLRGLPPSHPCSRLHGHNYTVTLELLGNELDEIGFICDYRELDAFKHFLDETYDHRHLNEIVSFNPTAENLARHFFEWAKTRFPALCAVHVSETEKTSATFEEIP